MPALVAGVLLLIAPSTGMAADPAPPPGGWTAGLLREHPLAGRVWSARDKDFVPAERALQDAAGAELVLLGEIHDNPDHHRLQAHVIGAMVRAGRRPAVAFEQIPRGLQPALDAHLAEKPGDAAGIGAAVDWTERGWPDWAQYQPIADAALAAELPLLAADPDEAERRAVGRGGLEALPPERRAELALDRPYPEAFTEKLGRTMVEAHCGLMPIEAAGPLVDVQRLRDATLADTMVRAVEGGADGAVLITGDGHAQEDLAAPWYLRARLPEAEIVTIAFREVEPDSTDPAGYVEAEPEGGPPFDYVWFTPATERGDPCAEMRERFGGGKR